MEKFFRNIFAPPPDFPESNLEVIIEMFSDKIVYNSFSDDPDLTLNIIEKYSDKNWNWKKVSHLLTMKFINDFNDDLVFDWSKISEFCYLTKTFIKDHLSLIDWNALSSNKHLTEDIVEEFFDKIKLKTSRCVLKDKLKTYDMGELSKVCPLNLVEENLQLKWNFKEMSSNEALTEEFVKKYVDEKWDWKKLSSRLSLEFLKTVQNKDINLSLNPSITPDKIIIDEIKVDWEVLSDNKNLTSVFIHVNRDKPWNWDKLSRNPCVNMELVLNNFDKGWNKSDLSKNLKLTLKNIQQNIEWLIFEDMSYNPSITKEILENFIDKPWNWKKLSIYNKFIDIEFIKKHSDKDWLWFS